MQSNTHLAYMVWYFGKNTDGMYWQDTPEGIPGLPWRDSVINAQTSMPHGYVPPTKPLHAYTIFRIKQRLREAARLDTAFDKQRYLKRMHISELAEHCAVATVALVDRFGGLPVQGTVSGESHYWWLTPGGQLLDFTACQFNRSVYTNRNWSDVTPLAEPAYVMRPENLWDKRFATYCARANLHAISA